MQPVKTSMQFVMCGAIALVSSLQAGPIRQVDEADAMSGSLVSSDVMLVPRLPESPAFARAIKQFKTGKYDSCLNELEQARTEAVSLPPPRIILARLLLASGKTSIGRKLLEEFAADEPTNASVYLSFGQLAIAEQRLSDAQLNFRRAQSLALPENWAGEQVTYFRSRCTSGLAKVFERRLRWKEAEKHLSEWVKLDASNSDARTRLARAHFAQGQAEEAYDQLQQARRHDPTLPSPAVMMSQFCSWWETTHSDDDEVRTKSMHDAEHWLLTAIDDDSANTKALVAYARWLLEHRRPHEAETYARRAEELQKNLHSNQLLASQIARARKKPDEAVAVLERLYTRTPGDFVVSNLFALALAELEDETRHQRGLQIAEVNVRQYGRSAEALATLGWIYWRMGRQKEARQLMAKAIAIGPITADIAYFYARTLDEAQEGERIRQMLAAALKTIGTFVYEPEARRWHDDIGRRLEQQSSGP